MLTTLILNSSSNFLGGNLEFDLLEHLPIGIQVLEPVLDHMGQIEDFCFRFINERSARCFEQVAETLIGQNVLELLPFVQESGLFENLVGAALSGEATQFEQSFENGNKTYLIHVNPYQTFLLVTLEDISSRKLLETYLKEQVQRDSLTGLHNRFYFENRAKELFAVAKREAWQVGLIYMDLDGFKSVNDSLGHAAGDALLKGFANRLKPLIREQDIFFRMGGDEFGLFLAHTCEGDAYRTIERFNRALKEPLTFKEETFPIRASMGVCVQFATDTTIEDLLECSDAAMYLNKRCHR